MLGNVIGFGDVKVRFYGSIAMTIGCLASRNIAYCSKMHPLLNDLEKENQLTQKAVTQHTSKSYWKIFGSNVVH